MGYFANGTEGEMYEASYCDRCLHSENNDCPIMALHLDWNYEQNKDANKKRILDMFIPREGIYNGACTLFSPVNMIPDRTYTPVAPEAYRLLRSAAHHLKDAVEATHEWAEEQLEEVQRHYAPDHECGAECNSPSAVWLANMFADNEAEKIQKFLAQQVETA